LHNFINHSEEINGVSFSPFSEHIFSSYGADRRVMIWDISKIGTVQDEMDVSDGPPELIFVHGGHTSKINDFGWNNNDK